MTATTAGTVGLTRALAEFLSDTAYGDLPPAVSEDTPETSPEDEADD